MPNLIVLAGPNGAGKSTIAPMLLGELLGVDAFVNADADLCVQRVAARRRAGGHTVDEPIVRRRYERSVRNFFSLYRQLADHWQVYDNSARTNMVLVAEGRQERVDAVFVPATWDAMTRRSGP